MGAPGGVIDELGRVDAGTTQTDAFALGRQRGITICSAVLDGVVLVVSAAEGVQAQTRVLMRALRRLALPALVLVDQARSLRPRT